MRTPAGGGVKMDETVEAGQEELTRDLIFIITFQPFTDFDRIRQRKYEDDKIRAIRGDPKEDNCRDHELTEEVPNDM
ncbi:MAG: hypothetical protein QW837_06075 [Conexivisphaerales archaeon]